MERLAKLPRPCTSLVATASSPHSFGQNHEREKTTRTMQQQKLVEAETSAGASAGVGSGSSHVGVGLMLLSMLLILSTLVAPAAARTIAYCSDVNTGSDYDSVINEFQSHGLCYDNCNAGNYAFAIVQGAYCWCSNYVPGIDVDGSECSEECPGYPDDACGNTQKDLFGYMALARKPSGTKGAETTTTTATSSSTTQDSTTLTTRTTSSKTTATAAPGVTVTVGGTTIVKTPTATPSNMQSASSNDSNFFSNAGRAAGLIVGLILAFAFIVAGVLFWRRRRQQQHAEQYGGLGSPAGVIPPGGGGIFGGRTRTRSMSTLGLVGEKGMHSPTGAAATPAPALAGESTPGTVYDQRLDPSSLFMRFDHRTGSSRMSVRSLRDDTDYSRRVLRLANPDDA